MDNAGPRQVAGISRLSLYVQGMSSIPGVENPIKLSSNESSHGPSPKALEAYRETASEIHRYPDGDQTELRRAIAEVFALDAKRILCGNGSDELILLIVRAFVTTGDEVLLSENGFEMNRIHSLAQGGEPVIAPEKHYRIDVEALIARASTRTKLCILANPNNPTGTYLKSTELQWLRSRLPSQCLLVVDGAYADYVQRDDFESGAQLAFRRSDVVMTRTFSKIYGLAGLRIGWAYCPENVIDALQRIRTPFNTNAAALAAATAAVRDQAHIVKVRRHTADWLGRIKRRLEALGLEVIPSVANFYLMRFTEGSGKNGTGAAEFLMSRGIIPRPTLASDQYLRITVGLDHENEAVLNALTDYMTLGGS